jgi:molybdopterin-binding protein
VFRSEDVTLYTDRPTGSVRNVFRGHVTDLEPVQRGVEVEVDVGVPVYSLVTAESVREMGLTRGAAVWIGVKSTALRAVPL